jgi:CheY-like chemotaxis protein
MERVDPGSLLQPFPGSERARTVTRPGSGLAGLLAGELARVLGGRVVSSRAMDGSVVLALEVPVSVASSGRPTLSEPTPAQTQARTDVPRILLVDDNAVGRYVMCRILEQLGVEVLAVDSGEAAIARVRTEAIDLVLMDCLMPGMDGLEATRRIREEEPRLRRRVRLPIVALTARSGADEEQMCRLAGMDAFMAKPVRSAELRAVLMRWLGEGFIPRPVG